MLNTKHIVTSTALSIKGVERSVIYDLPKHKYEFVPNSITDFLTLLNKKSFNEIYTETQIEYRNTITEYIEFCIEMEYVLEIPHWIDKKNFPKLNLEFEFPSIISNLIIKLNANSSISYNIIKDVLSTTKCYNIQLIFEKNFELNNVTTLLNEIAFIGMRSIEIIMPYNESYDYEALVHVYKNIAFIFIYSAPESKFIKEHYFGLQQIFTSTKDFEITHIKSLEFFNVNITLFTESQKHNTYFNRKLFIGVNGEIKNSSETTTVFGNVNDFKNTDDILAIIKSVEFQKYWYVHKGLIDVCKQCEFRHMCVDNRVPVKRNDKEWYMETECNYNPYIAKWKGEEGYKTLSECGVTSNQDGFKINRKKLNKINKDLWGD